MKALKLISAVLIFMFYLTTLNAQMTVGPMVIGQGVTSPSDWVDYNPSQAVKGIYVDVNTSACGFTSTPHYLVTLESITNNGHHWEVSGVPAIYAATPTGFRVYLRWTDHPTDEATIGGEPNPLRASTARAKGWVIRWTGIVTGDCAACGNNSQPVRNMNLEGASSVEDKTTLTELKSSEVTLFPNPSNTTITIQADEPITKCAVYDLQGQLLMTTNESTIDISDLPSGSYIAHVFLGEKKVAKQFVKKG